MSVTSAISVCLVFVALREVAIEWAGLTAWNEGRGTCCPLLCRAREKISSLDGK